MFACVLTNPGLPRRAGFTLVEVLVTMAILALLSSVAIGIYPTVIRHAQAAGCLTHMRSLAIAFTEYAGEHDGQLPGRSTGEGTDKWPTLLLPYVSGPRVYVDPGDPVASAVPEQDLVSNSANNSSFFFNGFNDLGAYTNPNMTVRLSNLTNLGSLLLLGQKVYGSTQYYMDFVEGNENDILNKTAYFGGSNYAYADGSASFMPASQYSDTMWLVNQNYVIPPVP